MKLTKEAVKSFVGAFVVTVIIGSIVMSCDDGALKSAGKFMGGEDNELSESTGGKFFGRGESEYSGRPFVFSNRGEVEILEKFFADYNNMDGEAVAGYFADEWTFMAATGGTSQRTSEGMKSIFDSLDSVTWTPFSMVPVKIYDTDPASGVTVYSTEKRVNKDGTVWEKDLVELFFFDLEGKISGVEQYVREISGE